ncbi:hypothetical protein GPECTOR_7g1046 [Gonium pectorale]|uniref:Uncharacterized protein n=1 Tax=Gonium pectorale TaxID=33097 RepID=A0A150GTP8_GONPE|nr:hypothetical protein GPECTOR_7g1046 [Gonium pectorale]|eukprot:KXZ53154.1 hypothetical protein GPECTOR_7g1046 [Gonium pectorale]
MANFEALQAKSSSSSFANQSYLSLDSASADSTGACSIVSTSADMSNSSSRLFSVSSCGSPRFKARNSDRKPMLGRGSLSQKTGNYGVSRHVGTPRPQLQLLDSLPLISFATGAPEMSMIGDEDESIMEVVSSTPCQASAQRWAQPQLETLASLPLNSLADDAPEMSMIDDEDESIMEVVSSTPCQASAAAFSTSSPASSSSSSADAASPSHAAAAHEDTPASPASTSYADSDAEFEVNYGRLAVEIHCFTVWWERPAGSCWWEAAEGLWPLAGDVELMDVTPCAVEALIVADRLERDAANIPFKREMAALRLRYARIMEVCRQEEEELRQREQSAAEPGSPASGAASPSDCGSAASSAAASRCSSRSASIARRHEDLEEGCGSVLASHEVPYCGLRGAALSALLEAAAV